MRSIYVHHWNIIVLETFIQTSLTTFNDLDKIEISKVIYISYDYVLASYYVNVYYETDNNEILNIKDKARVLPPLIR